MEKSFLENAVGKVMHFETEELFQSVVKKIQNGYSVLVYAKSYLGNGHWKFGEYRYKLLVPIFDNDGRIYSTDLFKTAENAIKGRYEIYIHTRQRAMKIIATLETDISGDRFGFGYTEESYGRLSLEEILKNNIVTA